MNSKRFNPKKLDKLNNPKRLEMLPVKQLVEKLDLENPSVIIDFGAGTGLFSRAFADIYSDAKIYACDIADEMIQWMNENVVPNYERIIPLKTNEKGIELDDEIADLLIMINLHHEIDEHDKILNNCRRLLKDGGKILISDWKKEEMEAGPSVKIRVSAETVKEQLIRAGFKNPVIYSEFGYNYVVIAQVQ